MYRGSECGSSHIYYLFPLFSVTWEDEEINERQELFLSDLKKKKALKFISSLLFGDKQIMLQACGVAAVLWLATPMPCGPVGMAGSTWEADSTYILIIF